MFDAPRMNQRFRPLVEDVTNPLHGQIACKFCGCPDLRIGGRERETFLACPKCGADGPVGRGVDGAVEAYRGWPNNPRRLKIESGSDHTWQR